MLHSLRAFETLLALLKAVHEHELTAAEKADVLATAREVFENEAHDPRLSAIVDRLTIPAAPIAVHTLPMKAKRT